MLSRELEVYLAEALPKVRVVPVGNMVSLRPEIDEALVEQGIGQGLRFPTTSEVQWLSVMMRARSPRNSSAAALPP